MSYNRRLKSKIKTEGLRCRPAGYTSEDEEELDLMLGIERSPKDRRVTYVPVVDDFAEFVRETNLGNVQGVAAALAKVPHQIEDPFPGGWNALMNACCFGFADVVELLLQKGANPNATNLQLITPLMAACSASTENENILKCVKLLIDNVANVNAFDYRKITALMYASKCGNRSVVQMLIGNGANINLQDYQGWTALFWAVNADSFPVVELLVRAGAKTKKRDERGRTAFQFAISREVQEQIANLLCPIKMYDEFIRSKCAPEQYKDPDDAETMIANMISKWPEANIIDLNARHLTSETCPQLDLVTFLTLRDEDLKDMGIKYSWHRQQTLEYIKHKHLQPWTKSVERKHHANREVTRYRDDKMKTKRLTYAHLIDFMIELEQRTAHIQALAIYINKACPLPNTYNAESHKIYYEIWITIINLCLHEVKESSQTIKDIIRHERKSNKVVIISPDMVTNKKGSSKSNHTLGSKLLVSLIAASISVVGFLIRKNKRWM